MKLNEAKKILNKAGYLIESDTQDFPQKYYDDVCNNILVIVFSSWLLHIHAVAEIQKINK